MKGLREIPIRVKECGTVILLQHRHHIGKCLYNTVYVNFRWIFKSQKIDFLTEYLILLLCILYQLVCSVIANSHLWAILVSPTASLGQRLSSPYACMVAPH
ncbi:hypothetical protein XELAEV_18030293mg [Xenopus laevis]|uniref:Uncharacterized protein n=1 Tax=Xenopus laevis TaxID=8355 RepID=A0A974CTA5_XENLA|nr:hypothetical protein XELAEV_18030293mg [Xenopus laevis]